ncbi:MAG TPA: hypothetical protein VJ757_11580 [Pseudonocardiaceae bacterium]|nr:hypothetical protein [Pseudonocardiaceae bacterium]
MAGRHCDAGAACGVWGSSIEIDIRMVAAAVPLALRCYGRYVQQVAEFVSAID